MVPFFLACLVIFIYYEMLFKVKKVGSSRINLHLLLSATWGTTSLDYFTFLAFFPPSDIQTVNSGCKPIFVIGGSFCSFTEHYLLFLYTLFLLFYLYFLPKRYCVACYRVLKTRNIPKFWLKPAELLCLRRSPLKLCWSVALSTCGVPYTTPLTNSLGWQRSFIFGQLPQY